MPTNPCSMGARHKAGEAVALVSSSNLGTCERVPRGGEPGCRGSDAQPRRGASLGTLVQGVGGLKGSHMAKEVGGLRVPSSWQDLDGGE